MRQSRAHALLRSEPATVAFALTGADAYGRLPTDPHYGHSHAAPPPGRSPLDHDDDHDHRHAHVVTPDQLRGGWREQLGVVLAVGMRPCSGALIVLAFALSQGLLAAGIVAVLLMGLGTAITTGALATMAVGFKGLARRMAGADNRLTGALVWWAELLAAGGVCAFGIVLLLASI
jgi:ABC-type nickel/cobalt efflux system permease component RcnA